MAMTFTTVIPILILYEQDLSVKTALIEIVIRNIALKKLELQINIKSQQSL